MFVLFLICIRMTLIDKKQKKAGAYFKIRVLRRRPKVGGGYWKVKTESKHKRGAFKRRGAPFLRRN